MCGVRKHMPQLPEDLLRKRVLQEIAMCKRKLVHEILVDDPEVNGFPVTIEVNMKKIAGPKLKDNRITHAWNHKFTMKITNNYPYQKPIVRWHTDIFHPNIMVPEDGGYVCTRLLDTWNFQSNLLAFIQGIESLLSMPNPRSPYGSQSCMAAAQYFATHDYHPPGIVSSTRGGPKIVRSD